jgi:zinc/manganese transport system substrate-binding protein
MKQVWLLAVIAISLAASVLAWGATPITVVAAENFYGDVANQIGGSDVTVTSILTNPDQDPHLFEASPSVARAVSAARIVIYNGIGYDAWIERLLRATPSARRKVIVVAELVGRRPGDNPHIWYDPAAMLSLAQALAEELGSADPAHRSDYRRRLAQFQQSVKPIQAKIAVLRERFAGTPVTATESVFEYMFNAMGMDVRNRRFQLAVMNNAEPSASDVVAFEQDLKRRRVRMLVYNSQASSPMAERMVKLATASGIPVVAVTETAPPGKNYQAWMSSELDAVERTLLK